METYQILAMSVFVPACVYFNWRAGYNAGVHVGINSAVTVLETMGAIDIQELNRQLIDTSNNMPVNLEKTE